MARSLSDALRATRFPIVEGSEMPVDEPREIDVDAQMAVIIRCNRSFKLWRQEDKTDEWKYVGEIPAKTSTLQNVSGFSRIQAVSTGGGRARLSIISKGKNLKDSIFTAKSAQVDALEESYAKMFHKFPVITIVAA